MNRWALAFALAMMAAGCTQTPAPEASVDAIETLPGTSWRFLLLLDDNGSMDPIDVAPITLAFDEEGALAGSSGCNRYFGSMGVDEAGKIEIGPLGSTRMACDEGINSREYRYLQALESCTQVVLEGDHLELLAEGGSARLVFQPEPDAEDAP